MHHHPSSISLADFLPFLLILLIGLGYTILYFKEHWQKKKTKRRQLCFFLIGILLLLIGIHPKMAHLGHQDLRVHMIQHLLIAMYAPIFLVMGAPINALLKALPTGIARQVSRWFNSTFIQILTHPFCTLAINIGGMFAIYLTPLFEKSMHQATLHTLVHIHFILAGFLFTWSIIGQDVNMHKTNFKTRLIALFIAIAAHAYLSKYMYAHLLPQVDFYTSLQKQEAAKLMYYWGDLSEMIIMVILFAEWYRSTKRSRLNMETAPPIVE